MYSLTCGSDLLDHLYNHNEMKTYSPDWYKYETWTPGIPQDFSRIVGNTESLTAKKMERWIRCGVLISVPSYDGKWNTASGIYLGHMDWQPRPVFGLYYSALFK